MKINKLIFNILFLYFSIFFVLFSALYLMMPFSFNFLNYIFISFLNIFIGTIIIVFSMFLIYINIRKITKTSCKEISITHKNCDIVYWICENIPFILYLTNFIISAFLCIIFKDKMSFILSLLSMFSTTIFYIFSQTFFKDILDFSESNFRPNTINLANIKNKHFTSNISLSTNLIFEVSPLIVTTLLIALSLSTLNLSYIIFTIFLVLICTLSITYISVLIYNSINNISKDFSKLNFSSLNGELGNLIFKINATNQIYNDYIKNLQTEQLDEERLVSIEILRRTVDAKDSYTRGHSDRVAEYSVLIGEKLGLSKKDLQILKIGGLFHDIGKIGIPDSILLKNGKLSNEEYNEIKKHPSIGAHILGDSNIFKDILPIVLYHHERFDGYGYPEKLKGSDIPLMARIVSISDTFDAMTSKRVYRDSLPLDIVKREFQKCSGTQFDPQFSKIFLDILNNDFEKIENIIKAYK